MLSNIVIGSFIFSIDEDFVLVISVPVSGNKVKVSIADIFESDMLELALELASYLSENKDGKVTTSYQKCIIEIKSNTLTINAFHFPVNFEISIPMSEREKQELSNWIKEIHNKYKETVKNK